MTAGSKEVSVLQEGQLEVKRNTVGCFFFVLRDFPGNRIAVSRSCASRNELDDMIETFRGTISLAPIGTDSTTTSPRIRLTESGDHFSFSLLDKAGSIVLASERYDNRSSCLAAITTLRSLANVPVHEPGQSLTRPGHAPS